MAADRVGAGAGGEGLGHLQLRLLHLLQGVHLMHWQGGEGPQVARPRLLLATRPELLVGPLVSPEEEDDEEEEEDEEEMCRKGREETLLRRLERARRK